MITTGFLGLGTMGSAMARNLAENRSLIVYNRTPRGIANAETAKTPADVAVADMIFACVSDDAALREVLFGERGLLSKPFTGKTLVDCGTTSVPLTREIARRVGEAGGSFADAPVTGSKTGAEEGTLLFMVGADPGTFDSINPLLQLMGKRIVHCGPVTYGQRAKIALNLTQALILESYLEGCALALREGIPLEVIREILDNSGARSGVANSVMPRIEKGEYSPHFKISLMHKDLKLAEQEMSRLKLSLPLAKEVRGIYARALREPDADFSVIVRSLEDIAGVSFSKK